MIARLRALITPLNAVFVLEIILFVLIVLGIIPRQAALWLGSGLALYTLLAPIEDALNLFVRSIPLFLALPLTPTFDNFNTWRILSLILFGRWLWQYGNKQQATRYYDLFRRILRSKTAIALITLFLIAIISVFVAPDKIVAIKRIIYFLNLSLIGFIIYDLVCRGSLVAGRLVKSIATATVLAITAGYIQVIATYFIDIYQFMRVWGEGIQMRQFGAVWSDIAVRLGNTWFAYYGDQLSLRVFSLFPDSHSFPIFVLLGIPALFAVATRKISSLGLSLKQLVRTRPTLFILWVPLAFLIAILSGTRGIWAASIGVVVLAVLMALYARKEGVSRERRALFSYTSSFLVLFFMLFSLAYPIFTSPQFLLSKGDWSLLAGRIRSIIDFGETSNAQRIEIWKKSISSIKEHPLLGVGIGNFPVVLDQKIFLAKAGSSAHNIYLNIAAEIGVLGLIISIWLLWRLFSTAYKNFVATKDASLAVYFGALVLYIPWVMAYSLTDVALFDERAFLLFVVTVGLVADVKENGTISSR
ncbi:MAG: O-antigen ligase family protein [Patescibacteria group bacterium]